MYNLDQVVAACRAECDEDYLGLWQIAQRVKRVLGDEGDITSGIVFVVARLLTDPAVTIGEFNVNHQFIEWPGDSASRVRRVIAELAQLGGEPDIGDVGWLTSRTGDVTPAL